MNGPLHVSPLHAVLLAALGAALTPLSAQDRLISTVPQGSLKSVDSMSVLEARVAALAGHNEVDATTLRQKLRTDESMWVTPDDRVLFVDPVAAASASDSISLLDLGPIPLEDAFLLNSNPGAPKTIYLDFDGYFSSGNSWGHSIQFPPYDTDGDSNSFSDNELSEIIAHWRYVVEDFAPFDDVNVTTEDPGVGALSDTGGSDNTWGIRSLMTQPTSGFGDGIGGVAFLGSFDDSIDNPCFTFNKGVNNGSMTASHEVGHTLGLSHDGLGGSTYHPGAGSGGTSWGPIMGAPFGSALVQWSRGDYASSTTSQDDIAIITNNSNGLSIRDDDHSNSIFSATALPDEIGCPNPVPSTAVGIIERRTDLDAFEFDTVGGAVTIRALPLSPGGNLDMSLKLYTNGGSLIDDADPSNGSSATLEVELAPGTYRILVEGVGNSNSSDYGSLGNYRVRVSTQDNVVTNNLGGKIAGLLGKFPTLKVEGGGCAEDPVDFDLFGARPNSQAYLVVSTALLDAPFKGGSLIPDLGAPSLLIPVTTSGVGSSLLSAGFPDGFPSGAAVYVQYWIVDSAAIAGYAATVGREVFAP